MGILRERPDVNVVLHFQSEYATAVSCMKNKPANFNVTAEIPCHVGSEIPVIPYYRPGSPELAKAVVEAMQKHNSVLLTNHGQVVCGKDFDQVYERATFFEMACRIIVQSGGDYSVLTPAEIEDLEIYVLGRKPTNIRHITMKDTIKHTYLAADFGGGSGRIIVGFLLNGRLELEEIYRFSNRQVKLGNHIYWDFRLCSKI